MSVQLLTRENFDDAVARHAVLVVAFAQTGADPAPLDDLARGYTDVGFGRVDLDTEPELCAMFGLPPADALVIFRERVVLYCEPGLHPGSRVEALLAQVRALDMDAVRAAIETEKQAEVALRMRRVCPTARRGRLPAS
jgi:thioredoxin 1